MDFLPIFIDLKGRHCLVVGAGEVAARKASLLLEASATVRVVAPRHSAGMGELIDSGGVAYERRGFEPPDLDACMLVIAATDDARVNREISELARERGLPVNVVDEPALSSFIMPSIVDRSPVLIAVSTGGASPVLSRLIRGRLEASIPAAYGRLATLAREFRARVKERLRDGSARRAFWEETLEGPVAELVFAGREDEARRALHTALESAGGIPSGEVYLVGAGPGDPDLLTARAIRLMQKADVVVYDRLVSEAVLSFTRRDAERIYAGKRRSRHVLPQESINELLIRLAREGKRVLRLKGGDPFIFGRGGEEIDTLADNAIPFQVVPGITAAAGCAAYAGIPLTHRDYAQSCVFVTGHLRDDKPNIDWGALVRPQQTIVVYMGLIGLPLICESLIAHGMDPEMPAAMVEHGTTPHQRVLTATLSTLAGLVAEARFRAPTLTIIGEVVRLHQKLRWFETRSETEPGTRW